MTHNNAPSSNSLMTARDLQAALDQIKGATANPLNLFPPLNAIAGDACLLMAKELLMHGVAPEVAERALLRMHHLASLAALSVRHACLEGYLPEQGSDAA